MRRVTLPYTVLLKHVGGHTILFYCSFVETRFPCLFLHLTNNVINSSFQLCINSLQ
jgi:hypothetical protein